MIYTYFKGEVTTKDPWDARTLEWSLPNPPAGVQFPRHPDRPRPRRLVVREAPHGRDRARRRPSTPKEEEAHGGIHMPFQSIYPFLAASAS